MGSPKLGPSCTLVFGISLGSAALFACTGSVGEPGQSGGSGATGGTQHPTAGSGSGATGPGTGGSGTAGGPASGGASNAGGAAGTSAAGSGTGGASGAGGMPSACAGAGTQAVPFHARLLSPAEYDNAVEDLVKVTGKPAKAFAAGASVQLDPGAVEVRANVATDVARQAAATLAMWAPCSPPTVPEATCRDQLVDQVGARAYRRVLTPGERTELTTLFDAGAAEGGFATGVEWFLSGLFQSPDFLYEHARVAPDEVPGQVRSLSGTELASRLSFFLWSSPPDDVLRTAGDTLLDPTAQRAQIDRMITDPRFERSLDSFYTAWLRLSGLRDIARDDAGFTTEVVNSLTTSVHMSITSIYAAPAPQFEQLLTGESYFMDATLKSFYGANGDGSGFTAVSLAGEGRRGLLTHPTLMALLAKEDHSSPIARGLFTLRSLLCGDVPPPDGIAIPAFPEEAENLSTRDRLEQHVTDPMCKGCHAEFDYLGYAYENFDEVGRYRAMDGGKPVDSSGIVERSLDFDGPFANGAELFEKMAASNDVKRCFVERYFEFAVARRVAANDACALETAKNGFVGSADLKELAVSLAGSTALRERLSEGVAP
jgi:hypothetical protein